MSFVTCRVPEHNDTTYIRYTPCRRFSLSFNRSEIPQLHLRLAEVSERAHEKMRRAVLDHASAFSWQSGGMAYEYTRYSLCLRAGLSCHHLRPQVVHHNVSSHLLVA